MGTVEVYSSDNRTRTAVPPTSVVATSLQPPEALTMSLVRALRESGGIVAGPRGAAARLGLKRTTLQSMMRKLGIRRPAY